MTDKSHVTMEQKVCPVCGQKFNTDAILLDRRLKQTFDRATVTGWGLCPEHQQMYKDGYLACIEIDPDQSNEFTPDKVYRLGRVVFLKREIAKQLFKGKEIPDDIPLLWMDKSGIDALEAIHERMQKANNDEDS